MNTIAYIGVGSNLKQPRQQVQRALEAMAGLPQIRLLRRSPWYGSQAIGPGQQADYVNGVIELNTTCPAQQLLEHLQTIEQQQGRQRGARWAARTLDLDLLLFGEECLQTANLTIPHPRLHERAFVLEPLAQLIPTRRLPAPKQQKSATIVQLLEQLPQSLRAQVWLLPNEHSVITL